MRDEQRERIAKLLLQVIREIWCDRGTDEPPYFNCSVCEFEDGGLCRLKQFIETPMYNNVGCMDTQLESEVEE